MPSRRSAVPKQVLKYLARYTHRVAISNARLLDFEDGMVRFRYKDYAHGNRKRVMTLTALEFVRRLLLHVLPTGFVRIRHYGILANRHRHEKLALCRRVVGVRRGGRTGVAEETREIRESPSSITPTRVCPVCGAGRMIVIEEFPPMPVGQEAHEGARARASASTVRNLEGGSGQLGSPKTTVVRGGAGIPRAEAGKAGESRRNRGVESDARARIGRVKPGRKPCAKGLRVGEDPPRSEPGGRLKYQRESAHREAAQFNGIVSGGPASAWEGDGARRPSGYNSLHFRVRPCFRVPCFRVLW